MAKRSGMYGRDKRQKELKRKKKQEEKQLRRQMKAGNSSEEAERTDSIDIQSELPDNSPDVKEENEATEMRT
jgi:hypothetical protein